MSDKRTIFNIQTGETTTVDLTSEEIAEREAIAVENAKVLSAGLYIAAAVAGVDIEPEKSI